MQIDFDYLLTTNARNSPQKDEFVRIYQEIDKRIIICHSAIII
jgi:hypothetical protein